MDRKIVVSQDGMHKCSICGNEFNWKLKIEILINKELERKYEKISSVSYTTPNNCVTFKLIKDDKIIVNIFCPKCGYMFETGEIDRLKQA